MNNILKVITLTLIIGCGNVQSVTSSLTVTGKDGVNGQSCTLTNTQNNTIIQCGSTSVNIPKNINISGYIQPCSKEFNNEEIFLRLSDGNVLMVYDGGNYLSRLAFAVPNSTYITTDRTGSQCQVRFDNCLNVTTSPIQATGIINNPNGCNVQ